MNSTASNAILGHCPICLSYQCETIYTLDCGGVDHSVLYSTVNLRSCLECGHVFNHLSDEQFKDLSRYYTLEYGPTNLAGLQHKSNLSTMRDAATSSQYGDLFKIIEPHIESSSNVLDVGCGTGGLLDYLYSKGLKNLCGIDMIESYVNYARQKSQYPVQFGYAESLPFQDNTFDIVIMDQLLEHLKEPGLAIREANRVLKKSGILVAGVPDASRYADYRFFDFYWLLLREHIHHFDCEHLSGLAESKNFKLVESIETENVLTSEKMIMPNLYLIWQKCETNKVDHSVDNWSLSLVKSMKKYLNQEHDSKLKRVDYMKELGASNKSIYVWGIGREFFYLYEGTGLNHCKIGGLIDSNLHKQDSFLIDGRRVLSGEKVLPLAGQDSMLLITALAHSESIINDAKKLGYRGIIMEPLKG